MITEMREQYQQVDLLKTFEVRRSSYSYRRDQVNRVQPERARLKARVIKVHEDSRQSAGSRTIAAKLQQGNESIGRYKVRRLMKEAGIESKQPNKPHRYKVADKPSKVAENHLNREYTVDKPNRVWCGDVTYVWCGTHWLYLALVIDLFARRLVGWACSTSPDTILTKRALQMAIEMRGHPEELMYHSDQGCHYTSHSFQKALKDHDIKQSMSRRGNCWDNVIIERTFRSFKTEWMPKQCYRSYEEAEYDIFQFVKYYNGQRCHSYNNYLTPMAAEALVD